MKTIKNEPTQILKDKDNKMDYLDLAEQVIMSPDQEGLTMQDILNRKRILDAITTARNKKADLVLEDADYVNFKAILEKFRWGVMHRDIADFLTAMTV